MTRAPLALLCLLLTTSAPAAWAQTEALGLRDLIHARNVGMGGAFRAQGIGVEIAQGSPATLSLYPRYNVELTSGWDPATGFAFGGLGVVDSLSSQVAMGVSYYFVGLGEGPRRRTAHVTSLAASMALSPAIHVGASGRYLLMDGVEQANAASMDVGLAFRPLPTLMFAVTWHNLLDTPHEELAPYGSASAALMLGQATLGFDVEADTAAGLSPLAFRAGGEYLFGQLPIRAGWTHDARTSVNALTAGIGWLSRAGSIDLGYRHDLDGRVRMLALTVSTQR